MKKTLFLTAVLCLLAGNAYSAENSKLLCSLTITSEDPNDWAVITNLDISLDAEGRGTLTTDINGVKLASGKTAGQVGKSGKFGKLKIDANTPRTFSVIMGGFVVMTLLDQQGRKYVTTMGMPLPVTGGNLTYISSLDFYDVNGKTSLSLATSCLGKAPKLE